MAPIDSEQMVSTASDASADSKDYRLSVTPRVFLLVAAAMIVLRVGLTVNDFLNPAPARASVQWHNAKEFAGSSEPEIIKASGKKLILYEFYADWCSPCTRLEQDVMTNDEIRSTIEKNFVSIRVTDRLKEDGKNDRLVADLQRRYRIFAFPTVVAVGADGESKGTLVGNSSSMAVYRFLTKIINQSK
jgi:thiol:disulfide interchange protein